jgi:hypothetical protein
MLWRLVKLIFRLDEAALCLEERAEQRGPPILEVAVTLESTL